MALAVKSAGQFRSPPVCPGRLGPALLPGPRVRGRRWWISRYLALAAEQVAAELGGRALAKDWGREFLGCPGREEDGMNRDPFGNSLDWDEELDAPSHDEAPQDEPPPPAPLTKRPATRPELPPDDRHGNLITVSDVPAERVEWLWPKRIPLAKLTVLDGDPGLGKSTLTLDLTARVTTRSPMPDGTRSLLCARAVIIVSAEDGIADTMRPRLEAAGADLERVHVLDSVTFADEEGRLQERPPEFLVTLGPRRARR